jgi:type II secretory pathway pseudopilin PulG
LKQLRPAFTIIEILISVLILSGSIVYALQIHSQNREQIIYISERNKQSLQDSLFLTEDVLRYHKDKKEAYELLQKYFKITSIESREILKKSSRTFFIPEQIKIVPPPDIPGPSALVDEIDIKARYSASYFHFKIISF